MSVQMIGQAKERSLLVMMLVSQKKTKTVEIHGHGVEINRLVAAGIDHYAMKAITYKLCQECINVCWILEESSRLFSL